MRPLETRDEALRLVAAGVNDCEIARRLGVPRTTVRDWRQPRYVRAAVVPRARAAASVHAAIVLEPDAYAELLGLYLGDGHITEMARSSRSVSSSMRSTRRSSTSPRRSFARCFPDNRVGRIVAEEGRMVVLWAYSSHLTCLFPQHGEGKKHERPIVLEPWQQDLVDAAPWAFLRGCIRSDGCVFINRTGPYEYLSYDFTNHSEDILDLFEQTCLARPSASPLRRRRSGSTGARTSPHSLEHVGLKS